MNAFVKKWAVLVACLGSLATPAAHAAITDPTGDFLPTFAGSTTAADLDVVSASVTYDPASDLFLLSSTLAGPVGQTPAGFYVWGVNRGAGTASFAANGIDGVLFDRVVILRPDGTGNIGGAGNLPAGSVTVSGNTISAIISGALLPSTGFDKTQYTWNLWPRDGAFTGFAAISDFAPDNSNFVNAVGAVPEPSAVVMALLGGVVLAARSGRRGGQTRE